MEPRLLRELLERVRGGEGPVHEALAELESLPFRDLGFASVDHHRALRQGVPEVIFGQGKTVEQITGIVRELVRRDSNVLITRLEAEKAREIVAAVPGLEYLELSRTATFQSGPIPRLGARPVALV